MIHKLILSFTLCFILINCTFAAETVEWKIQTNKPVSSTLFIVEEQMMRDIENNSQGALKFTLKGNDGFVPFRSVYNAVRTGEIDAMLMTPSYWASADPVFAIIGDLVAAWSSPEQYNHWLREGGGFKYLERAYQRVGLKVIGYSIATPESIVSRYPIANTNDFKGLVMRAPPGMIGDFFQSLGVKVKHFPVDKVLSSLQNRRIDAADFLDLTSNHQMGAYKIVKHTNYPGFHSMPLYDFVVREQCWNDLSQAQQQIVLAAIEKWQTSAAALTRAELDKAKKEVLLQGVTLHHWNKSELAKARQKAVIIWHKYAGRSPEAKELIDALKNWFKIQDALVN